MRKSRYTMAFPVENKYLLINGLSGAVKLVSKETAQKFFNDEVTEELRPFFTHFAPEEEYEKARAFCDLLMKKAAVCADGTIAVTYDCNLRCPYCYEIWVKKPEIMKVVMDQHKVDKAFKALEYLNRECSKEKSLTLTGGEPLMKKNRDIVEYLLKKGDDLKYTFTIFTNGIELDHFLPIISSMPLNLVLVTLDGPRSLHDKRRVFEKNRGTFHTIVQNIEKARTAEIPLVIRTNADPEILSRIDELATFYRERGWVEDNHIRFLLSYACDQHFDLKKIDQEREIYRKIMDLMKKPEMNFFEAFQFRKLHSLLDESPRFWPGFWNCNAVINRYVFDPFGHVYPCRSMLGWKEERIGEYMPELSFNEKYHQWRRRTIFNIEKCTKCDIALVCGGDCGCTSLMHNKTLFAPLCTLNEDTIVYYLEYLYNRTP